MKNTRQADKQDERNIEFEETLGAYLSANAQVDKLRKRLELMLKKDSSHMYKFGSKWYRVGLKLDQISLEELDAEQQSRRCD